MSAMENLEEFKDTFQIFCKRDTKIVVEQVGELVRALGLNPLESDIQKVLKGYESEEKLSFEEFVPIFRAVEATAERNRKLPLQSVVDCINTFDREGNGFIHSANLRRILTGLGESRNV